MVDPGDRNGEAGVDEEPLLEEELRDWDYGWDEEDETEQANGKVVKDTYAEDPYRPFDDLPQERPDILTVRAVVLGLFCGTLVNASNVYLGLKAGWGASANIFGAIVGFTVLKQCSRHASHIPFLGGSFGPRENNIVQTAATASGGMANVFVSAFPAMYQLNLLSANPSQDFWRIVILTAAGGYFGTFFGTPLRKFFIIYVARELGLIFPSSSATAITIRSMHLASEGGGDSAQKKVKALVVAFIFAVSQRIVSQYAVGLLWDWHIFTWLFLLSGSTSTTALAIESWGWFVEWTPAFIGSGMLVGVNVAGSFLAGSVVAWGVVGPYLVANDMAFGTPRTNDTAWAGLVSYTSLAEDFTTADHPSPRYWLVWPGILCMVTVALLDLLCQWRIFLLSGRAVWTALRGVLNRGKHGAQLSTSVPDSQLIQDPALPRDQVPAWIWAPGLAATLALTCWVMSAQYGMFIGETLLALTLTFFFSFLAIQATGATDITPLSGASASSQMILGAATQGPQWTVESAQRMNLLGGALASLGASHAADLVGDYRVGFLLRTSPRLQWYAQFIGTACSVFIAPAVYVLFASAYPCINDSSLAAQCPFQIPAASAWRAVAVAVTEPTLPVPLSSQKFALVFAAVGAASVLVRQFVWVGKREWVRQWHPNMMVFSMAFIIPATVYGTAMTIGAVAAAVWKKRHPAAFEVYAYAVAAGFMAGEGIGGIANAVLQILGLAGDVLGTQVLCPDWTC